MSRSVILANVVVRLRTLSREKFAMFFTFLFPLILILVFGVLFTSRQRLPIELHVQDLDGTAASAQLLDAITAEGILSVERMPVDVDAEVYAKKHERAIVMVIPQGFAASHEGKDGGRPASVRYVYDPAGLAVDAQEEFLHATLSEINRRIVATVAFIRPDEQPAVEQRRRFFDFFVPGIIAMAIMTASLYGALAISAELRQKGILRKLAATPITRSEWLLSNVLYQLVLAVISTALILAVAYVAFDAGLRINLWLIVFVVLSVFTFVGMGMVLTPLGKDAESASAVGNAVLFPMMFLSGTFFPVQVMPEFLQAAAYVLPLYYINEGFRAAMLYADHAAAMQYAAITAGFAAALFIGGALATHWDERA